MSPPAALPPFPDGWYAVGLARDLPRGEVWSRTFLGREVVVFRTAGGELAALDAHCPHLGAHMGHGGRVVGETLRCPFHGFRFDAAGRCVATGYGTRPPPKAVAGTRAVREVHGVVLVHHDAAGAPPAWEVPAIDAEGWRPLRTRVWALRGHPQETTENSVDVGHFGVVHGYSRVETLGEASTDGPYLTARYAMTRRSPFGGAPVRAEFEVHVWGLGFSFVEARIAKLDLAFRFFVLPRPLDGERIELRVCQSMRPIARSRRVHPGLALVPRALLSGFIDRATFANYGHDVSQDFEIWRHKRYVHPPALAAGDGPIGLYRRWARQFYPELREEVRLGLVPAG
jgi:phenylpropionate dioxygenase-like ring-hydroxylating dioxygenase large terminal subunit